MNTEQCVTAMREKFVDSGTNIASCYVALRMCACEILVFSDVCYTWGEAVEIAFACAVNATKVSQNISGLRKVLQLKQYQRAKIELLDTENLPKYWSMP